jgi:hypothetical protein
MYIKEVVERMDREHKYEIEAETFADG